MVVTGGCYCGEVRYEINGPQEAYVSMPLP